MSVGQKLIKMKKIIVVRRPDGTAYNVCLDPKDQGIECLNQVSEFIYSFFVFILNSQFLFLYLVLS